MNATLLVCSTLALLMATQSKGAPPPAKPVKSAKPVKPKPSKLAKLTQPISPIKPTISCSPENQTQSGCEFTRLDCPGGSMEKVPVPDQGDLGICYSVAATEAGKAFIDTFGDSKGDKSQSFSISPLHSAYGSFAQLALEKQQESLKRVKSAKKAGHFRIPIEGGYTYDVLDYLIADGACPKSVMDDLEIADPQKHQFLFQSILNSLDTYAKINKINATAELMAEDKQKLTDWTKECLDKSGIDMAPEAFNVMINGLFRGNTLAKIHDDIRCPKDQREYFPAAEVKHDWLMNRSPKQVKAFINNHFNQKINTQPLIIRYCSQVLKDGPDYEGLDREAKAPEESAKNFKKSCGGHASIIIGRKYNPKSKKCQFLVQNSWGATCQNPYSSKWECESETGKIWIDADDMANNVYGTAELVAGKPKAAK